MSFKNIKEYAQHLLIKTDFVDCYGRNVGLDYETILDRIRAKFPHAKTSKRALRFILYGIDRHVRMPARHRSRNILRREYARALLLRRDASGLGLSLTRIRNSSQSKFRGTAPLPIATIRSFERALKKEGIKLPEKRA